MAKPRRSRRPRTTLLVLVLASISIITLDARGGFNRVTSGLRTVAADALSPVQSAVDAVVRPVGSFLAGSVHYGAVRQQNQKLQAEIGKLRQQMASAPDEAQALHQLQQLSALNQLPLYANLQLVPCAVTNYNSSDFAATITLDKGRSDGVAVGMPVVGSNGLVGQVVETSHHTATVRLVTDGRSVVGVRYGTPPGALATVTGTGWGKPLAANLVPPGAKVTPGEIFVTSGLQDAAFPASIPVATVVSAKTGAEASQETVRLKPIVDLAHLRYVSVVLWASGTK